jgi:hypothetical protein
MEGLLAPGRMVTFQGPLQGVAPQTILTDFLVDHVYPVAPREGTVAVATQQDRVIGTHRAYPNGGTATFLGYRPRDDQSASLGYETRNWFEILAALGAYNPTGRFPDANDNTEYISRTTDFLACRFPNGTTTVARHFKNVEEEWPGGFARKADEDQAYLAQHPLPDDNLSLVHMKINGREVSYEGRSVVAWRVNKAGALVGFAGTHCQEITIDGRTTKFAEQRVPVIAWAPVPAARQVPGGAVFQAIIGAQGTFRIPLGSLPTSIKLYTEGATPGSRGHEVTSRVEGSELIIEVGPQDAGRWLWGVPQ